MISQIILFSFSILNIFIEAQLGVITQLERKHNSVIEYLVLLDLHLL